MDLDVTKFFQVRLVEEYFERRRSEPFALWVSFLKPHSPFDLPSEFRERFDARRFTPPRIGPEDAWQVPEKSSAI